MVARLVDRVGYGDHARKRRLDHVVAVLGLALDLRLPVLELEARGLGDHREPQAVGHGCGQHRAVRIAPLLAEEDEVGALALERLGERPSRGDEIRARERLVGEMYGPIGADRECLAERVRRLRRPHEERDDLSFPTRFLHP